MVQIDSLRRYIMRRHILILTLLLLFVASMTHSQTPDIYWGLDWKMTAAQVDSTLNAVLKEKKNATKTNFSDNRQLSGYSYGIAEKGIQKIYVWFNMKDSEKVSIHSVDVLYNFEYPYDAQRFKQAYFEKYGHVFEKEAEPYQVESGSSVLLRLVKEPPLGKLGPSVYQVSMLSPIPFDMSQNDMEFLF
jgi:hypothetical protein